MVPPGDYTSHPVIITAHSESLADALRDERNDKYPLQVWYFLVCFIFLVSVINWIDIAFAYVRAKRQRRRLAQTSSTSLSLRGSIDLLRLPLALTDTFRALSFRWTIPIGRSYSLNIMQVLLSATYIVILFAWSLINRKSNVKVKRVPDDWADLSGRIAAIQLPLIVGLGMKNNLISCLTGVSFEKLNYLHRMTSRVMMVLVWLHSGTRVHKVITLPGIRAGVLAAAALTLLCIVWVRPIRGKAYELFLVTHLLLALIIVLSAYFHAKRREVAQFVWPAMALWALDRFIRMCRLAISFFAKKHESGRKISSEPKVEILPGHLIRLTTPTPKFFHWRPGQTAYLILPQISRTPFEGHPFTISTIDTKSSHNSELKFLIQSRKGFTRRLHNSDISKSIGTVLIDGPYSSPPRLVGYDSVLLIAGGSGVSFTLPLLLDLLERSKSGMACRRLTFVWTVRQLEHIVWIEDDLLGALKDIPPNLSLNIHIFAASNQNDIEEDPEKLDDTGSTAEKENGTESGIHEGYHGSHRILSLPMIKVHQERADLPTFIKNEVAQAHDCMSVNVCGSEKLNSAVRESIRTPRMVDILRGGPTISLHVESFENAVRVYSFLDGECTYISFAK
ncbi:hypothetical protein AGABI1DRAFT_78091 [Agaricus bisporus var. burnettii JB137-S8]|uniref:ferric-chelate reductase (NADPH) n=1 Tax=Agaricus bisporus var. burnettii (strain JB137-S8 / ATCC MYA-4627 / FGSC 10392) TaxID=597362 RepID=K5VQD9_AGABU|nr:uncharacterized protein AGABI1DRAFT_78091 [Agaricus bisporus var. burnettii JB137-S8]EKM76674.1 hypothetical protein AGABI1DRAFT_78091 [Agaricus bisporus var. burnettii JB137-S8]